MLLSQFIEPDRVRHWSSNGCYISQIETDTLYEDAVDNIPCQYTHEETDELIPEPEEIKEEL
jgi:hypothetical protein